MKRVVVTGGLEAIIAIKAIRHGLVPPTTNLENQEIGLDLDLTPNTAKERKIRIALSNTSGFGGTNSTLVFKAFEE